MIRFVFIVAVVLMFSFTLSHFWPAAATIAFTVSGVGITWILLTSAAFGALTYKFTGK